VWNYIAGENEEPLQYHMDIGQEIKFRVAGVLFNTHTTDTKPKALDEFGRPVVVAGLAPAGETPMAELEEDEDGNVLMPSLTASQAARMHSSTIHSLFSSLSRQAAKPSVTAVQETVDPSAEPAAEGTAAASTDAPSPAAKADPPAAVAAPPAGSGALGLVSHEPVMQVNASIAEDGLGLLAWWAPVQDHDDGSGSGSVGEGGGEEQ